MHGLNIVIVQLKRCIAAKSLETNDMICVIVNFGANFAEWQIV